MTRAGSPVSRIDTGILVFPDVEVLDFCGPFEVFSCTRLEEDDRRESESPFDIKLIAVDEAEIGLPGWIRAYGGLKVEAHCSTRSAPPLDVLVVPGGWGVRDLLENRALLDWLSETAASGALITSVCTGAMLLGQAGLLEGKRATTHWQSLDWMRASFPGTRVVEDERFVDEGSLITAAGVSAGIDMALHVVERFHGSEVARRTMRYMQYRPPGRGVGTTGPEI